MKTKSFTACLALVTSITVAGGTRVIHAAEFSLSFSSADGGGGSCSGGVTQPGGTKFAISGTIGQPDAGGSAAGTYVQQGGFMAAFTLPVTPALNMSRSGNLLTFTWPHSCTGFVLETLPIVNEPVWTSLGSGTTVGAMWQLITSPPSSQAFFRLRKDCPK